MKMISLIVVAAFISLFPVKQRDLPVVSSVDINRYLGTWYEIARLPFSFESNLKCITATYSLRKDGRITVLNKGYYINNPRKTTTSRGVAFAPDDSAPGKLKVQFFWPFRGNYWIMELDEDYRYVMVGEPRLRYLWILAREKTMDDQTFEMLLKKAALSGYDLNSLIIPDHDCY
ncbi:MAG: lipocalin family protein [Bacteroidales bacterium]|nr:lipocalin family protein [Bacteroidales bacterium]